MIMISNGDCLLRASCLPAMKKDKKYTVSVTINHQFTSIIEAAFYCPAWRGPHWSHKHITALCFCIESFVRGRDVCLDLGEEACIATLQKWNQLKKALTQSKVGRGNIFQNTNSIICRRRQKIRMKGL